MAADYGPIDIAHAPDLARLVDEVTRTGRPRSLARGGQTVAVISPVKPKRQPRERVASPRRGVLSADDTLWNIVGIGRSDGPGDVSENKHTYLAAAYMPKD